MKKLTAIILCVLLLAAVTLTSVFASADSVQITPSVTTAQPGDTVEFIVSVSNFPEADSLSVAFTVPEGLTAQDGEWVLGGGLIKNYMPSQKLGIWAADGTVDLSAKTDIFKLTCTVNAPIVGQTDLANEVKVQVKVMANDEEKGLVDAAASVTVFHPATELNLAQDNLTLDLSTTLTGQLTATYTPANTTEKLSWVSSAPGVATVSDSGLVTAVALGESTVTASIGSLEKTCLVTVICSHANATKHTASASTCLVNGNNLYYTCDDCGAVLKADKQTVTTVERETLPLADHQGGTATCTQKAVCGICGLAYGTTLPHDFSNQWISTGTGNTDKHYRLCNSCQTEKADEALHSFRWVVDDQPTEDTFGYKHEKCSCGVVRSENTRIEKLPHQHIGITHYPAVRATCQTTGKVEYWTCSSTKCEGKYFGDGNCQVEITELTVPVNANNHASLKVKDKVAETCNKPGYSGDTWCTKCNILVKKGEAVPATGVHVGVGNYLNDKDQHWKLCSCGEIADEGAHTPVTVNQKEPTLTETGYTGDQVCSVCEYVISKGEEIPVETQPVTEPASTEATAPSVSDAEGKKNDLLVPAVIVLVVLVSVTALLIYKRNNKR